MKGRIPAKLQKLISLVLLASAIFISAPGRAGSPFDTAGIFVSFNNFVETAAGFASISEQHIEALSCLYHADCGQGPAGEGTGHAIPISGCCDDNNECSAEYDAVRKMIEEEALKKLYKNEYFFTVFMAKQDARIQLMRSAASAAPVAVPIGSIEAKINKAKSEFLRKFNDKADHNINELNKMLLKISEIHQTYCSDPLWYDRSGLPIYLMAKFKFPK
jgi:hypothetical protein